MCPINKFTKTLEFIEDGSGGGGPAERPFVGVVVAYVSVDLAHQFTHAAKRTATNRLLGDEREPALDLVKPAGVSGRVMNVIARAAGEPGFDLGMFVGGVVVGDQVQLETGGNVAVEMIEKGVGLRNGFEGRLNTLH